MTATAASPGREEPFTKITDLQNFANKIKGDVPYSYSLYNALLIHSRGLSCQYEFYTHKVNSEESHIIMSKHKDSSSPLEMVNLHCLEEEAQLLIQALRDSQLVSWDKEIVFNVIPEFLLEELQAIMGEKAQLEEAQVIPFTGMMFAYTPGQQVECPAGYSVKKLGTAGLHTLFNAWRYNVYADIGWYSTIVKNGLACGVYTSEESSVHSPDVEKLSMAGEAEVPVAWITLCPYGQLGLLVTDEAHRQKGFGVLVTQVAAQLTEREGFVAQAMVEDYNIASQGMFHKMGWRVVFRGTTLLKTKEGLKVEKL